MSHVSITIIDELPHMCAHGDQCKITVGSCGLVCAPLFCSLHSACTHVQRDPSRAHKHTDFKHTKHTQRDERDNVRAQSETPAPRESSPPSYFSYIY